MGVTRGAGARQGAAVPAAPTARPPYARPDYLAMLVAGGALGTSVRAGLEDRFAAPAGAWPWATFGINVAGSFLLGALLTALARTGADAGWRRRVRIGVGTGVLGGFTTYSTFAVEVDLLWRDGHVATAVGYALGSVVAGVVAALAGVLLMRRLVTAVPPGADTAGAGTPVPARREVAS